MRQAAQAQTQARPQAASASRCDRAICSRRAASASASLRRVSGVITRPPSRRFEQSRGTRDRRRDAARTRGSAACTSPSRSCPGRCTGDRSRCAVRPRTRRWRYRRPGPRTQSARAHFAFGVYDSSSPLCVFVASSRSCIRPRSNGYGSGSAAESERAHCAGPAGGCARELRAVTARALSPPCNGFDVSSFGPVRAAPLVNLSDTRSRVRLMASVT
jgi:hypothetical protein